ncbi:hypothetical protein BK025_01430 [Sodalis sp. TME1]|nr:hypothetical protein BK025_01430 [Sodalis sp. TME1]
MKHDSTNIRVCQPIGPFLFNSRLLNVIETKIVDTDAGFSLFFMLIFVLSLPGMIAIMRRSAVFGGCKHMSHWR